MGLENIKGKVTADKWAKPYTKKTVIIIPGGKTQEFTKRVTLAELLTDNDDEYIDNPEDMSFRREMEGEW